MHSRPRSIVIIAWISLAPILLLGGCASTKESVLPQDGPSMKAIYDQHLERTNLRDPEHVRKDLGDRPLRPGTTSLAGYTRSAQDELDTVFPRLPNPTLVMYVFPHLAGDERVPVPGYVTTFPMYERVEYAQPGEASKQRPESEDGNDRRHGQE